MEKNKKELIKNLTLFAFCLAGLILLTVSMSLPLNDKTVYAKNGVVQLSSGDLEDKIISLQGQWAFHFGSQILTPQEMEKADTQYIDSSEDWTRFGYPKHGCAAYRLVVQTPEKERLTLVIPFLSDAAKVWVNGVPAYEYGVAGSTAATTVQDGKRAFFTFTAENSQTEIVVSISNFHYYKGGFDGVFRLGRETVVLDDFIWRFALYGLSLGVLLTMGIYHLMLYFQRKERLYLVFSLICFFGFVRFVFEAGGIMGHFNFFHQKTMNDFYFIAYFLYDYLIFYFSLLLSKSKLRFQFLIRRHVLPVATTVIVLLTPTQNLTPLILLLCVYAPAVFLAGVVLLWRSPERKQNPYMNLFIITFVFFVVMGFAYRIFLIDSYFMMGISSFLLLIIVQSLVLSADYVKAFRQVELINADLERRVEERTQELQLLNRQLTISQDALHDMLVNISHDLKTPLTVLSLNLQSLLSDRIRLSDEERQSCLNVAYHKNLTISRLIKNIFDLTRIDAGKSIYKPESMEITELLDGVQRKYADYIESKDLAYSSDCKDPFQVMVDEDKIWSVFDNIIYNAVRHTPGGGSITVCAATAAPGIAEIRVTDTGCGIPPEHIPHLFERFYKVSKARSEKDGEGGIGLYIVKNCVEGMGGSVRAESAVGAGTSIIFTLKAIRSEDIELTEGA